MIIDQLRSRPRSRKVFGPVVISDDGESTRYNLHPYRFMCVFFDCYRFRSDTKLGVETNEVVGRIHNTLDEAGEMNNSNTFIASQLTALFQCQ